jgi:hypothetical protein
MNCEYYATGAGQSVNGTVLISLIEDDGESGV